MTCKRCGSRRLYQFKPARKDAGGGGSFPLVCRSCGGIHVRGELIDLGAAGSSIESQAKSLAEASDEAGKKAVEDLEADPGQMISDYFARVYQLAYLDGFMRAYAFFRHEGKEGRIRRIRTLWRDSASTSLGPSEEGLEHCFIGRKAYDEIDQLLLLGDTDAQGDKNKR